MTRLTLATILVALIAGAALAETPLSYKLDLFGADVPRFVGSDEIGSIRSGGFRLYADRLIPIPGTSKTRPSLLLGIEYQAFDNRLTVPTTLALPQHTFNLGADLPLAGLTGIRLAASSQQYLNDDPYASFGIYPYRRFDTGSAELGFEQDLQHRTWALALGTRTVPFGAVMAGGSLERLPRDRGSTDTEQQGRIGAALLVSVPHSRIDAFGGGNYCLDDERFVWVGGLSLNANVRGNGIQPSVLIAHRQRPDSRYTLAIATLWGRTLHPQVTRAIHEAFFRGGLKETRVIGGRYMGDPGLGSEHEMVDFGSFAIALSNLEVDAGDATLLERDVTAYGTLPWTLGPLMNPVLGVTYGEFSDLIFNPAIHGMDDPDQRYWEFKLGIKVLTDLDHAHDTLREAGFARVWLAIDNGGATRLKVTTWF